MFDTDQGLVHVYAVAANGHLTEYLADHQNGHVWNAYDLTGVSGGGTNVYATPNTVFNPAIDLVRIYAEGAGGHLYEYLSDHQNGHVWNAYDLSAVSGGGTAVTGQPSTLYNAAGGLFHIYARGADGSLYEFDPDHQNGHIWNAYNLSAAAGGGAGTFSAPSAVFQVAQGLVHVYVSGPAGLTEYLPDHQGGHIWNAYCLQAAAGGGGPMSGDPDALYDPNSGLVHVYVRGVGNMLTDYEPDHASGHIWNAYNLSVASGGPAVASDPGAIVIGSTIQVYAQGA